MVWGGRVLAGVEGSRSQNCLSQKIQGAKIAIIIIGISTSIRIIISISIIIIIFITINIIIIIIIIITTTIINITTIAHGSSPKAFVLLKYVYRYKL